MRKKDYHLHLKEKTRKKMKNQKLKLEQIQKIITKVKKITTNGSKKETISNATSKRKENTHSNKNDKTEATNKQANNKHTHSIIGTSGMWVTSVDKIIKEWDRLSNYYEELLNKNKITWEEYCQKCPTGYYNVMHCVTDLNCNYITWDWQYVN